MAKLKKEEVLELARKNGILRPKDLLEQGIAKVYLYRLCKEGLLECRERGLYVIPNTDFGEHQSLAEVCAKVPRGVICLLSALKFHEITTQSPHEVWIAIHNKAMPPKVENIKLHIVLFSGKALTEGVETHKIKGTLIRVYGVAKTVVDCFKYRNKIGIDVAIEALQDGFRSKKCTMDELWKYAKICRVSRVMKPYMEMLG